MYHGYDGGGLEVNGPSVLVRKGFNDKVSVWAQLLRRHDQQRVDRRRCDCESVRGDARRDTAAASTICRQDNDGVRYIRQRGGRLLANTARFGISQDFFGDLTTLGISYARGWNDVLTNGDPTFKEHTDSAGLGASICRRSSHRTWC